MLSLTLWSKSMTAASIAVIAACGFLLIDDELNARAARVLLQEQWLPNEAATRLLLAAERTAVAAVADYQSDPSQHTHDRAESAVRALRDSSHRLQSAPAPLSALEEAARSAIDSWVEQRATPILRNDLPGTGGNSSAAMKSATEGVEQKIAQHAVELQETVNHTNALLRITVLIQSALLILLLTLLMLGMRTRVLGPLTRLRRDLERSAHHWAHVITPRGPAEIAAVAIDAEHMRRSLIHEHDASDQATQALEQAAPLTIAMRSELDRHDADITGVLGFHRPIEGVVAGDWWWAGEREDGTRVIALADISGHGVNAGMLALESRTLTTAALQAGMSLTVIAKQLSLRSMRPGMFLTLFMCELKAGALTYCSAGHPFAAICGVGGNVQELPPTGPVISALGGSWETREISLPSTSALITASDGLLEAAGDSHFLLVASQAWSRSAGRPSECLEQVLGQSRELSGQWADDVTVVIAS